MKQAIRLALLRCADDLVAGWVRASIRAPMPVAPGQGGGLKCAACNRPPKPDQSTAVNFTSKMPGQEVSTCGLQDKTWS
jgi:hypothetical protein